MLRTWFQTLPTRGKSSIYASYRILRLRRLNFIQSYLPQYRLVSTQNTKPAEKKSRVFYALLALGGAVAGFALYEHKYKLFNVKFNEINTTSELNSEVNDEKPSWHTKPRPDLPTYKTIDVQNHSTIENRVWVTYGVGVYDITEFIAKHPGGEKIMLGAGSAIDPFWAIYQQHNNKEILTLLELYRIGNLSPEDEVSTNDMGSPWANEPKRHPILKPASIRPFNAEPPLKLLGEHFFTPNEFFYIRNHLPVPILDIKDYELEIAIETTKSGTAEQVKSFTFNDIKRMPKYTVTAAIMCGGNRRSEMTTVKSVKGLSWNAGAVGNATWSGVRLRDVLLEMGVKPNENLHVVLEGADLDPTSHPYGASIPLSKAMDERGDVLLAYEMNDQPLSRDHGFPLRCIVPGTVGARNVKWLSRIAVSESESSSHWQQNDYKVFSPSTDWDTVDFSKAHAIQAMPVTSAICTPAEGEEVKIPVNGCLTVQGYAWSGGGRRILRVDLTIDQGKTWHVAALDQEDLPDGRHYAWSLWTARIPIDKITAQEIEIWAKAVDSAYNVQPETVANIWNLRGVLANAYHRIKVKIIQ
ncbi:PREDICTED: probable sulfite oxidase, mitochondrial [Rhagoletis zephyria]|uniref:probable sulfite oxidase, mitochondrial n=1 Tax=Rhagoletis zephyria TaxID=28612 RepID=UPI0008115518|nr:PREDICTED: probable sulfite oxidase, mitochondrial [Rhagoletis zephyria]XP_017474376.1 PREDICTED: probable sulfite oxidase, mitochondrial [Rhagoletis zephyria]XP_017474379.1 PREDICTED: probable sulfite oxidase, mitochondrial [Rhagoletis zephyria]XP_017474380.1 PREDICTED: probable sulfite oxidase, mitochondrial [Rhagoletis zephyria]